MAGKTYSEKEVLILEGLLALHAKGHSLQSAKVSDIAAEAGIGKGTVYEYFHSKEEIITNAIAYGLSNEFQEILEIIETAKSFQDCTYAILGHIIRSHDEKTFCFLTRPDFLSMEEVVRVFEEMQQCCHEQEKRAMKAYFALGEAEKILPPIEDFSYARQVVISAICGFHIMYYRENGVSPEKTMADCYHLLVKALS